MCKMADSFKGGLFPTYGQFHKTTPTKPFHVSGVDYAGPIKSDWLRLEVILLSKAILPYRVFLHTLSSY